jgi:hypothetical protein
MELVNVAEVRKAATRHLRCVCVRALYPAAHFVKLYSHNALSHHVIVVSKSGVTEEGNIKIRKDLSR